jgi:protein-disulfide isomerase
MAKAKVPGKRRGKIRVQAPPPAARRRAIDRRWSLAIGAGALAIVAALVTVSVLSARGGDESAADRAIQTGTALPGAEEVTALLAGIPQDGEVLGAPDAPVTLVVFADPQCPACAAFAVNTLPELIERYVRPGDLRIQYRGVAIIGPDSATGLRAAYAAGLQDKLWNFSDLTYLNQGGENSGWLDDEFIRAAAGSIPALDVARVLEDRESAQVERTLEDAQADAQAIGLSGTPTFQVGRTGERHGEPIAGGNLETLAAEIDPLLGR